jgi:DNA ligase (NAD+)
MKKATEKVSHLAKLRAVVAYHQQKYHTDDAPEISDQAYDALVQELMRLEEQLEGKVSHVSQAVGSAPSSAFAKVKHQVRQWSFDNVFNFDELQAWEERLYRYLDKEGFVTKDVAYAAEHKIDGLKLVMEYRAGELVRALTRGDGEVGEDVTHTARTIASLPHTLKYPVDLLCVGEVWMGQAEFVALNARQQKNGEATFANPRNAAAGSLRQLDPAVAKERALSLFVYDVDVFEERQAKLAAPTTQWEELQLLKELGLPTNPYPRLCRTLVEVQAYYEEWKTKSETLPYGVDGIVIKANDINVQQVAGYTAKSPRFGIAYKFPALETTTVVEAIDLQVGRTGVVTPVAHLRAVVVDGSTVTRATLHNEDQIERLDVRVGDTIIIRKAGDVIPEVVSVVKELRPKNTKPYHFPEKVLACGGDGSIERVPGTAAYRCVSLDSDFLRRQKMYYFVSKNALNMDGVGPRIIDTLLDHMLITDAVDLFTLTSADLLSLPGFKQKAADNAVAAITAARTVPLARLLVGLSIEHVGEETARLLAKYFRTIPALFKAKEEELIAVDGVGEIVAASILMWQKNPHEQDLLKRLLVHLQITNDEAVSSNKLAGKSFVFTGSLLMLSRDEAGELVRAHGGTVSSAVSKKTAYVVAGGDPGSKLSEAKKHGVSVLTEEEFKALVA